VITLVPDAGRKGRSTAPAYLSGTPGRHRS
jgi:hypothetical protein